MAAPIKLRHVPPQYRRSDRYSRLTYCPSCNTLALYEDMHPSRPCPNCGGKVVEGNESHFNDNSPLSGKWERTNGGVLQWFTKEEGVWRVTLLTKMKLETAFERFRAEKKERERRANPDSTFYNLDFTHLKDK